MITEAKLVSLLGADGFTTRKRTAEVLGYKDPHSVDGLLNGLERVCKTKYLSSDVAKRIMATIERT